MKELIACKADVKGFKEDITKLSIENEGLKQ